VFLSTVFLAWLSPLATSPAPVCASMQVSNFIVFLDQGAVDVVILQQRVLWQVGIPRSLA